MDCHSGRGCASDILLLLLCGDCEKYLRRDRRVTKLNGIDAEGYLRYMLAHIADHPVN